MLRPNASSGANAARSAWKSKGKVCFNFPYVSAFSTGLTILSSASSHSRRFGIFLSSDSFHSFKGHLKQGQPFQSL
jgi:hypothetical protein